MKKFTLPKPESNINLWVIYLSVQSHQVAQIIQSSLIQVLEEIPRTLVDASTGSCPDVVGSTYRHMGAIHTIDLWCVAVMKVEAKEYS